MGKYLAMFTDVNKNIDVPDVPAEEALKDMCTKNGVLNVPAYKAGMEMLRLLKVHMPPRNEEPTEPDPEAIH